MTDPTRFADDADPALALLLRAGQKEMPPRRALEKTLSGLGAATTVLGATHTAAAAVTAGKLGIWTLAKWAGAGMLSGVISVGGVELVQQSVDSNRRQRADDTSSATQRAAEPAIELEQRVKALPVPASELPRPTQSSEDRAVFRHEAFADKPNRQNLPVRSPEPVAAEIDPTMAVEIGLIDEARRALQSGRAAAALEAVYRHRTEVKRPRLAPEAHYLEMEALFAAGNAAAAQRAASQMLERYPRGPHAARARSILGQQAEPR